MVFHLTKHLLFITLGWAFFLLGVIGIFLPLLPTTPFLLLSLWAFARSSGRLHQWLLHHPRLGPPLQAWERYGAVPGRVKVVAVVMMLSSLLVVLCLEAVPVVGKVVTALLIAIGASYLLTRPSQAEGGTMDDPTDDA